MYKKVYIHLLWPTQLTSQTKTTFQEQIHCKEFKFTNRRSPFHNEEHLFVFVVSLLFLSIEKWLLQEFEEQETKYKQSQTALLIHQSKNEWWWSWEWKREREREKRLIIFFAITHMNILIDITIVFVHPSRCSLLAILTQEDSHQQVF
jgi:hypothetical protein